MLALLLCGLLVNTKPTEHPAINVLLDQVAAWNTGNLDGFLVPYEDATTTTFISGVNVERGFGPIRDRYRKRYGNSRETMGQLRFSELSLVADAPEVAVISGGWELTRGKEVASGRFTLVFRKRGNTWKIVYDHTSAAPPPAPAPSSP